VNICISPKPVDLYGRPEIAYDGAAVATGDGDNLN